MYSYFYVHVHFMDYIMYEDTHEIIVQVKFTGSHVTFSLLKIVGVILSLWALV